MTVIVLGGGPIGLAAATLLARDGHEVTVLEKDPQSPPATPDEVWEAWQRSGVAQFRQVHYMHSRFRHTLDAELPALRDELVERGARPNNMAWTLPSTIEDRSPREGDERFETITARRPVLESGFARAAEDTSGVEILRGTAVEGLIAGTAVRTGIPHVAGVRTTDGAELRADLVVDAMGRRSRFTEWTGALGSRPPYEEASDTGFAYYTRHYRGSLPEFAGPIVSLFHSFQVLTAPCDNDAWMLAIVAMAGDRPLKSLRRGEVWERVVRAIPHAAHWLDGEPIQDVLPMAGAMDRYRRFVVDGEPVVTGLVAIGDAWACTNPTAGRGVSLGLMGAIALRDVVREHSGDPLALAEALDAVTEEQLTPWYRNQVERDYKRAADVQAVIEGREPEAPANPMQAAFQTAAMLDPDVARGFFDTLSVLALPQEVMGRPGMVEKVSRYMGAPPVTLPGPTRAELLELVG